jgi:hypothetical protein
MGGIVAAVIAVDGTGMMLADQRATVDFHRRYRRAGGRGER